MATTKEIKKSAMKKVAERPSRPSLQQMRRINSTAKAQSTPKKKSMPSAKRSTPKVVGKRKVSQSGKSLANASSISKRGAKSQLLAKHKTFEEVAKGYRKSRPSRYRHRDNVGKMMKIEGRHAPKNGRYKTGYWRPHREGWMSDGVWAVVRALHRDPAKWMSKAMRDAVINKQVYGKEGPGHKGYGTGHLQKWSDYILRQNKGIDPHQVNLMHWFKGALDAYNHYFGGADYDKLNKMKDQDPSRMLQFFADKMQKYIPELRNLTKRDYHSILKNGWNTISYGPDGRAK